MTNVGAAVVGLGLIAITMVDALGTTLHARAQAPAR